METAGVEGGLVRILKRTDDSPAGLGFVVGERHVLTAAHVVNTALGRDRRDTRRPERPPLLTVEFVLLGRAGGPSRRARLDAWMVPGEQGFDGADVAGLKLVEGLPDGACPLRLEDRRGTGAVRMFGPRPERPQGGYVDGRVMGLVPNGRLQIDEYVVGVFQAGRGWSGGPVWDRLTGKVVGMLVAAPTDESPRRRVRGPNPDAGRGLARRVGRPVGPTEPVPGAAPVPEAGSSPVLRARTVRRGADARAGSPGDGRGRGAVWVGQVLGGAWGRRAAA
ncbi:MAG: trypsin-like peptidase domain-containing protein [Egibacteraceae bacterium]